MKRNPCLFWQPPFDLIRVLSATKAGKLALIILNYTIWPFFFLISFLLVRKDSNIFWQLFLASFAAELVERYIKSKVFWRRPMFDRGDATPSGLVDKWYKTGSFPSGHTIKAVFFFLFILQYNILSPTIFLSVVIPLIVFRVVAGFHYPIDILGGVMIGAFVWVSVFSLQFPLVLNIFVHNLFNFIFFVK